MVAPQRSLICYCSLFDMFSQQRSKHRINIHRQAGDRKGRRRQAPAPAAAAGSGPCRRWAPAGTDALPIQPSNALRAAQRAPLGEIRRAWHQGRHLTSAACWPPPRHQWVRTPLEILLFLSRFVQLRRVNCSVSHRSARPALQASRSPEPSLPHQPKAPQARSVWLFVLPGAQRELLKHARAAAPTGRLPPPLGHPPGVPAEASCAPPSHLSEDNTLSGFHLPISSLQTP